MTAHLNFLREHCNPLEGFCLRTLQKGDYAAGYGDLLEQLTTTVLVEEVFESTLAKLQTINDASTVPTYVIVVLEECRDSGAAATGTIVGTATLLCEQKFVHSASRCAHIEDVVVDREYRKLGLGKVLIDSLLALARHFDCYKTILDCKVENVGFYSRCTLLPTEQVQLAHYSKL